MTMHFPPEYFLSNYWWDKIINCVDFILISYSELESGSARHILARAPLHLVKSLLK